MPGSVVSLSGCGVALFVLLLLPNPIRLILNEFLTLQSYTRGTVDLARPVQHSLLRVCHRTLRPLGPSCSTSTPSLLPPLQWRMWPPLLSNLALTSTSLAFSRLSQRTWVLMGLVFVFNISLMPPRLAYDCTSQSPWCDQLASVW